MWALLSSVCIQKGEYTASDIVTIPYQSSVQRSQLEIPLEVVSSLLLALFFMYTVKSVPCVAHEE